MTFQDDLAFGKDGEERVAAKLVQLGFIVSPLYQYEDHKRAPVLFYQLRGAAQTLTHPDLAVFGKTCCFAEVKRKQRWVDFDRERGLETGCDLKLWHQYRLVRRVTGLPVWLFFIHERQEPTGRGSTSPTGSMSRVSQPAARAASPLAGTLIAAHTKGSSTMKNDATRRHAYARKSL